MSKRQIALQGIEEGLQEQIRLRFGVLSDIGPDQDEKTKRFTKGLDHVFRAYDLAKAVIEKETDK